MFSIASGQERSRSRSNFFNFFFETISGAAELRSAIEKLISFEEVSMSEIRNVAVPTIAIAEISRSLGLPRSLLLSKTL
jgi:hypothetical protein